MLQPVKRRLSPVRGGRDQMLGDDLRKRARSTMSICAAIVSVTVLVFMLSPFDPSTTKEESASPLEVRPRNKISLTRRWRLPFSAPASSRKPHRHRKPRSPRQPKLALHGLGTLFRRGSTAMDELVVAHVDEETTTTHLKWFLRTLHRSGVPAKADVVLLFPWNIASIPAPFVQVIEEENRISMDMLSRLADNVATLKSVVPTTKSSTLALRKPSNPVINLSTSAISSFKAASFTGQKFQGGEPLWGLQNNTANTDKEEKGNNTNSRTKEGSRRGQNSYGVEWGSMVGFDVNELNPDDALRGFIDDPPMHLRRWACYQMLLGKLWRRFKHVMLTDVRGVLVLGDVMSSVRKKNDLHLTLLDSSWSSTDTNCRRNGRGLLECVYGGQVERDVRLVNSGVIMGGIQAVRKVANAMTTEIVRVALRRNSRDPFSDAVLLTYLVRKSSVLGKKVMDHTHCFSNNESVVLSLSSDSPFPISVPPHLVVHGYADDDAAAINVTARLLLDICSSPADSHFYYDCTPAHLPSHKI